MLVLGLDVSTSAIGWCFAEHSTTGSYRIEPKKAGFIDLKKYVGYINKTNAAVLEFEKLFKDNGTPDVIQIEDSLQNYKFGSTSVNVIITLARFNGIITYILYRMTKLFPNHIHPVTARKRAWGSSFSQFKREHKKAAILAAVYKKYPTLLEGFPMRPRAGGFRNEVFDMADAVTLAVCIPDVKINNNGAEDDA